MQERSNPSLHWRCQHAPTLEWHSQGDFVLHTEGADEVHAGQLGMLPGSNC
jgi:hypothetical protein